MENQYDKRFDAMIDKIKQPTHEYERIDDETLRITIFEDYEMATKMAAFLHMRKTIAVDFGYPSVTLDVTDDAEIYLIVKINVPYIPPGRTLAVNTLIGCLEDLQEYGIPSEIYNDCHSLHMSLLDLLP